MNEEQSSSNSGKETQEDFDVDSDVSIEEYNFDQEIKIDTDVDDEGDEDQSVVEGGKRKKKVILKKNVQSNNRKKLISEVKYEDITPDEYEKFLKKQIGESKYRHRVRMDLLEQMNKENLSRYQIISSLEVATNKAMVGAKYDFIIEGRLIGLY